MWDAHKTCFHIYELSKQVQFFLLRYTIVPLQDASYPSEQLLISGEKVNNYVPCRCLPLLMYDLQLISPSSKSLMVLYQVAHIPLLCMVFHAALCNTGNTGPGLLYKTDRIIGKCLWNYCSTPCCWKCIFQSQFRWPETIICSTQNSIRWLQSFLFSPCFWIELTYLVFCSGEFMLGLVLQINCYHGWPSWGSCLFSQNAFSSPG